MKDKFEYAVSISALIVAICAMVITFFEMRVIERHQKIMVWPRIGVGNYFSGGFEGRDDYRKVVSNVGLGPAVVKSVRFLIGGQVVTSIAELTKHYLEIDQDISKKYDKHSQEVLTSDLGQNSILKPGDDWDIIRYVNPEFARHVFLRMQEKKHSLTIEICYCSLYDDCWIAKRYENTAVDECPYVENEQFKF